MAQNPLPLNARFLLPGATQAQRLQAAARNHAAWFAAKAAASGGETNRTDGIVWTYTPGPKAEVVISFPRCAAKNRGAALDAVIAHCRSRGLHQVSCWSLFPARPPKLGAQLASRGFEWGWQPHWMALDLSQMRGDFSAPPGEIQICVADAHDGATEDAPNLPYYDQDEAGRLQKLGLVKPRRTWHFMARQNGALIGHTVLFLTTGPFGVAGIYNVGVVPSARNQGLGRALTVAACRFAQSLGCHFATLNAAVSLYEKIGFVSLGYGQTWWMHKPVLDGLPPTPEQIAFAEAIAGGDTRALNWPDLALLSDLNALLPNGMTPLALAVAAQKPASAQWLAAQGAKIDLVDAWDLGWKQDVAQTLLDDPARANRKRNGKTPLHEAVERGDAEFVALLLTARPDLNARDDTFEGTPLGWAQHLGNAAIAALLQAHL